MFRNAYVYTTLVCLYISIDFFLDIVLHHVLFRFWFGLLHFDFIEYIQMVH